MKPKRSYRVQQGKVMNAILSHLNPAHTTALCFFDISLSFRLHLGLTNSLLSPGFSTTNLTFTSCFGFNAHFNATQTGALKTHTHLATIFLIYFHTTFRTPSFNGSPLISVKYIFRMVAMFRVSWYFSTRYKSVDDHYHMELKGSILSCGNVACISQDCRQPCWYYWC
jgi:hypothetical protein